MDDLTKKIVVQVLIADGEELKDRLFKCKPPRQADVVIKDLKDKNGMGDLRDAEGDNVLPDDVMEAGQYTYKVHVPGPSSKRARKSDRTSTYTSLVNLAGQWLGQDPDVEGVTQMLPTLTTLQPLCAGFDDAWKDHAEKLQKLDLPLSLCVSEQGSKDSYDHGAALVEGIVRIWQDMDRDWKAAVFINKAANDKTRPDVAWCGLHMQTWTDPLLMYNHLKLALEYKKKTRMTENDGIKEGIGQLISRAHSAMTARDATSFTLPCAVLDNQKLVAIIIVNARAQEEQKLYRTDAALQLVKPRTGRVDTKSPGFKELACLCWLSIQFAIRAAAENKDWVCFHDGTLVAVVSSAGEPLHEFTILHVLGQPSASGCTYMSTAAGNSPYVLKAGPPTDLLESAARLRLPMATWNQVRNEAHILQLLDGHGHPSLPVLVASGTVNIRGAASSHPLQGAPVVVTQPCGKPLLAEDGSPPSMSVEEVADMFWHLAGALAVLQAAGINHGDVHMRNMGWRNEGEGVDHHRSAGSSSGGSSAACSAAMSTSSLERLRGIGSCWSSSGSSTTTISSTGGSEGRIPILYDLGSAMTYKALADAVATKQTLFLPTDLLYCAVEMANGLLPGPLADFQSLVFTALKLAGRHLPWEAAAARGDVKECYRQRVAFMRDPSQALADFPLPVQQLVGAAFDACLSATAHTFNLTDEIARYREVDMRKSLCGSQLPVQVLSSGLQVPCTTSVASAPATA